MKDNTLHIHMLGSFELSRDDKIIQDSDNRSRKFWLLIAYLIYHRGQHISKNQLLNAIWEDHDNANPDSALKTLSHRARTQLDVLGFDMGKSVLQCKKGEYFFNTELSYTLDIEEFDKTLQAAKQSEDSSEKCALLTQAVSLYSGEFLARFSSESWVIPVATYYHNLYLDAVESLVLLLESEKSYDKAVEICTKATALMPYEEMLYLHLMNNLILTDRKEEAVNTYHDLADMLSTTFGVKPSDEVRRLYKQTIACLQKKSLEIEDVQKQLEDEPSVQTPGAMFCDYDLFSAIYHALSRGLERSGGIVHLAVLTITDLSGRELPARSLSVCVENLKALICTTLRHGDILSMCSPSQFVLMLPNANRENSDRILTRIEHDYLRRYPHTPARLTHVLQPVLPMPYHNSEE